MPTTNPGPIQRSRVKVRRFIIVEHQDIRPWAASGRLKHREAVAEGLERVPAAFLGLLRGENLGKQRARLA